jgi:HD-like signal output (HDOD) protein
VEKLKHDPDADMYGEELKAQRFQMLEDIAHELAGEVVFPTYFDAVMHLRQLLQDPNQDLGSIADAISMEPLISAKILHLANSVAYNPVGKEIVTIKNAVSRIGLNAVRSASMAIAMNQLRQAKGMSAFVDFTHALWEHSVRTAAAARLIAKTLTKINPEEAMLAGLVHDLGAFYMLYRATQYPELCKRPESLRYLIINWHESIGISLLNSLGLPEEIVEASVDHDQPRPPPSPIRNLSDIVYLANMLAGGHFEWLMQEKPCVAEHLVALEEMYGYLKPEIEALANELLANFS